MAKFWKTVSSTCRNQPQQQGAGWQRQTCSQSVCGRKSSRCVGCLLKRELTSHIPISLWMRAYQRCSPMTGLKWEEFLAMESMTRTTWGSDFHRDVWRKLHLPWTKSLDGTSDESPNLTEKNSGFLQRIQDQVRDANPSSDVNFLHYIIHQESLCKSVFSLDPVAEIWMKYQFCVNTRT